MDPMSGCDTPTLVFILEPKDSTLQYKKFVHHWNDFPCLTFIAVNQKQTNFWKNFYFGDLSFLLVPLAFSWFTSRLSLGFSLFSSIYLSSFLSPVDCRVSINSRIHSQQKVVFLTLQIWQEFVINLLIFNSLCLQYLQKKLWWYDFLTYWKS